MTRFFTRALSCAAVALLLAGPGPASAQSANGPTKDVVPRGRISQLVWMMGNWDCRIVDRNQLDYAIKMWRRVALGPGGYEIFVLQGMPDYVSRSRLGFNEKTRQWYEIDRVGSGLNKQQETLTAPASALGPKGITLSGSVPGKKQFSQVPLRGVYTWDDHDGFVFRAQLLRKDPTWVTFQKQSCRRSLDAPTAEATP